MEKVEQNKNKLKVIARTHEEQAEQNNDDEAFIKYSYAVHVPMPPVCTVCLLLQKDNSLRTKYSIEFNIISSSHSTVTYHTSMFAAHSKG